MRRIVCVIALLIALPGCRRQEKDAPVFRPRETVILRLHGSNTVGAKLGPALAAAYLRRLGADSVEEESGATREERYVRGSFGAERKLIEVWSYGSNTGFNDLAWGKCDIAMSSKPIDAQARQRLAALGDMGSPDNEHVIGLDGIAVIVNPANPLEEIAVERVADIFLGRTKDWARLPGGRAGPLVAFSRNLNSGTYDVFKQLALHGLDIHPSVSVCETNADVAEKVMGEPGAIGFVPAGAVGAAKALRVSQGGARALSPGKLHLVTEDYPLSRRLFLYTAADPANDHVGAFLDLVQSETGQVVVEESGFTAQILRLSRPELPTALPPRYASEVRGALRVGLNFRFRTGGFDLDNRARQDLARLARFLDKENLKSCKLKLFGFCDKSGSHGRNVSLSAQRAQVVADALQRDYAVEPSVVLGMGSALPVASNLQEAGREKNRRIEVWLQCDMDVAAVPAQ